MRRVWPFKPRTPILEYLEWSTDVLRAKASEQRIALRTQPRRVFQFAHLFRDETYNYARNLIRSGQGGGGFWVPDWTQSQAVSSITAGAGVNITLDLSASHYGSEALLWESNSKNEVITITVNSPSTSVTADVADNYTSPLIMPVWRGDAPEGLQAERTPGRINNASIGFVLSDDYDISDSTYPTYRSLDVLTDAPIVSSGAFMESEVFPVSINGSRASDFYYLRSRDLSDYTFQMRWHVFTRAEVYALRRWLHSIKGRQKAFWISTRAKDLDWHAISGTTVTVYNDVLTRGANFDIEILSGGVSYYRQVTAAVTGTPVGGRNTVDLTLNSSVPVTDAKRISYLVCARLDSDRVELTHEAGQGTAVGVACREVPVP